MLTWKPTDVRIIKAAEQEAPEIAVSVQSHGRSYHVRLKHASRGLVWEGMWHLVRDLIREWAAKRKQLRGKKHDDGADTACGLNLKAVKSNADYVTVTENDADKACNRRYSAARVSDDLSEYLELGEFNYSDCDHFEVEVDGEIKQLFGIQIVKLLSMSSPANLP